MTLKRTLARLLTHPVRAYVRHAPGAVAKSALTRRLLEPSLRGAPLDFTTTTVDGAVIAGNSRDMIQRYIYVFGVWEPALTGWMRARLGPGRTLIDVGANIGYFALLGSRLVGPTGSVVAVEALPSTFAALTDNVRRNAANNVRAVNAAATAVPGPVTLFGGESHNSGTTSTVGGGHLTPVAEVEGMPLADLLTPEEIATARIIKIDVEGAEAAVVEGLRPALAALPEDVEIAVELSPSAQSLDGRPPEFILQTLADHDFVPYVVPNDYSFDTYAKGSTRESLIRFTGPVTERIDLVFSRTHAEHLP